MYQDIIDADLPTQLAFTWQWRLRSSPERLWSYVANTDRFNRDTGLPAVRILDGYRHLAFTRFGIPVEWDEEPFEWVRFSRFGVNRRYRRGPVLSMRIPVELIPEKSGTRLVYHSWVRPRGALGWLVVPLGMSLANRLSAEQVIAEPFRAEVSGFDEGPMPLWRFDFSFASSLLI